jgi:peptidyl-prolyl cis-trans isomerase SurA
MAEAPATRTMWLRKAGSRRSCHGIGAAPETYLSMILRVPPLSAVLLAGLVLAPLSALAQSGSSYADTTSQQVPAYTGTVIEDIVARVNDEVISKSDYERAQQQLEQEAQQQNWSEQELMEQRRDLLRSLIDKQLLLSRAKELDISGDTELIKRLDEIRKQNNLDSMDDLQKAVEAQGISYEDFRQQILDNILTSEVISQEVGPHISVTQSEIQDYYNAHRQEFVRPEQVHLNEILISTPDPDNATQVAEAEKKADEVESRLKSGGDFATLAKTESGGPTAQQGGDLGDFKAGQLPKVMEDATFSLQPGQYTAPIRTKQGWLILQVTAHQRGGLAPLREVENQIQEQVGMSKMEPAMRTYLTKLREQAYITVRPGYVDSGASPNEIKFIQGAYVPPQPKKKKKVVRTRFNGRPARGHKVNVSASASAPAGVPTLDQVNSQKTAPKTVASNAPGTQKPGKKEKIRFGQAPRETLPTGNTRTVDAGATTPSAPQQQVAINQPGLAPAENAAPAPDTTTEKKVKTRYSDRLRETKAKRREQKQQAEANKHHKFVPPPESQTAEALAKEKREDAAYGLAGDTTKPKKKPNPAKSGPKRRLTDQDQSKKPAQNSTQTPESETTPPASTGTQTPQPQSGTQNPPPAQGTQPQPQS